MNQRSLFGDIPPVTKNLIIINLAIWLLMAVIPSLAVKIDHYCALHFWGASQFNPGQLLTYMFVHKDFFHVFFNMFSLFMFGRLLEHTLGSRRFLFFFISCGVGAGLIQEIVWQVTWQDIFARALDRIYGTGIVEAKEAIAQALAIGRDIPFLNQLATIGASGGVYGVLLAFGMLFPNLELRMLFVPYPIKAKWLVLIYGGIEVVLGFQGATDGIAHFAHLGGMIFGFLMIWYWKKKGTLHGGWY